MRRGAASLALIVVFVMLMAGPAAACGGLIGANGSVNLLKTSTLAAYHDGVEHYVTVFNFAGGGAKFGSIVPLPGIPSDVRKGGAWTLQRLVQEVQPPQRDFFRAALSDSDAVGNKAQVIMEADVDALDISIVKGGGDAIGEWAEQEGFRLTADAPEVLDFYADRSPVFMAVAFDSSRAAELGRTQGEGIPVHLSIPTHDPWVPLRILGLGKQASETVEADVFLLTANRPRMLPVPGPAGSGMSLERSEPASAQLLADLRSDRGMRWLPAEDMWFSYLKIDSKAGALTHDLAVDPTGVGAPSPVAAGLVAPPRFETPEGLDPWPWLVAVGFGLSVLWAVDRTFGAAWPKS